jgi:hypothetical protein
LAVVFWRVSERASPVFWSTPNIEILLGGVLLSVILLVLAALEKFEFWSDHIRARRIFKTTCHSYSEVRGTRWVHMGRTGQTVAGAELQFPYGRTITLDFSDQSAEALSLVFRQAQANGIDASQWLQVPAEVEDEEGLNGR